MAHLLPTFHCPLAPKNLLLVLSLVLWGDSHLLAQCDRMGRVISVTPSCGVVIKDFSTGQFFHAPFPAATLTEGEAIRFGADPTAQSLPCAADGLPTLVLTCVGDMSSAAAHFTYSASPANPLQYTFQARLYPPETQTCQWSFGTGALPGPANGAMQYTFSQPGLYTVCLTIDNDSGTSTYACREILVSEQASTPCGYDVFMTAVGTQLYAKLLPQSSSAGLLTSIHWRNGGDLLGEASNLTTELPGFGTYSICARYEVKDSIADTTCLATICRPITLSEPGCGSAQITTLAPACALTNVPVCGCDNITYENECDALAAGITTWWAGECNAIYGSCVADLETKIVSGNPDAGYLVQFKNLSSGIFNFMQLDFGDGSPVWEGVQWDSVLHHYAKGDVYRINLSTWKPNACASSVTQILVTDAFNLTANNLTATPDYVLPGDANGDQKANVYDLLNIGLGYLTAGPPRPSATTDWVPQFAANWPNQLTPGLNFKHFDCDGDGMVLDLDADVIEPHYSPITSFTVPSIPGAPAVWVKFDQDTILVDANNPGLLTIPASVMVGSPEAPALGLYGLAFALKYPEYVDHDPEVEYKNDFFGISNHLLWLPKDNYDYRQLDLGFTQKHQAVSGYGRIATVTFETDFIIIIDIIERELSDVKPFTVAIRGLKAVGADGQVINFGTSALQDTVWIKLVETSGTHDQTLLQQQVRVYPNPATGETRIFTGDLAVERLEAVNSLGQRVYAAASSGGQVQRLSVVGWATGLYTLRLQTAEGVVEKKLFVR